jgi:trans-aconitate methyltransferase
VFTRLRTLLARTLPQRERRRMADAGRYWNGDERDMAHWRGAGRFADDAAWRAIGEKHLAMLRGWLGDLSRLCVLEWGCGGGSNLVALCPSVRSVHAVDISDATLAEAARQAGAPNLTTERVDVDRPDGVDRHCDLFLSTAVFQHFPSKEYGLRVLAVAARLVRSGGAALIQIRYDDGQEEYRSKVRDYARFATTFTSYGLEEFAAACAAAGFRVDSRLVEPEAHYAYFFLRRA